MRLVGRRETISAPTVGYASDSTPVSTARPGPRVSPVCDNNPHSTSRLGPRLPPQHPGTSAVRKSSKRASAMSATHAAHSDQANQAAVRRLIPPIPRPVSLSLSSQPSLYSITFSQATRRLLRKRPLGGRARELLRIPPEKAVAAVTATLARTNAVCASSFMLL